MTTQANIAAYNAAVESLQTLQGALDRAEAAATEADSHESELASLQTQRAQVLAAAFTTGAKPDTLALDAQIRKIEKAAVTAREAAADARTAVPVLQAQVTEAKQIVNDAHRRALEGEMTNLQVEFDTHVEDYFKAVELMRSAIVEMEAIGSARTQLALAAGLDFLKAGRLSYRAAYFTAYDRDMLLRGADGREFVGALSTHGLTSKRDRLAEVKASGLPMHRVSEPTGL